MAFFGHFQKISRKLKTGQGPLLSLMSLTTEIDKERFMYQAKQKSRLRRWSTVLMGGAAVLSIGVGGLGCSKKKTAAAGSTSSEVVNVSGKVSESSTAQGYFSKPGQKNKVFSQAVEGCTVEARSVDTADNTVLATATTDSSGNYSLKGSSLEAGGAYRVTATCGANKYSSVAAAEVSNPATITDAQRVQTNPRSTVIAALIVKAIIQAVDEATSGLGAAVQAIVKKAVMSALDSVIQSIAATVNEAINSGAMPEPDVTAATTVASGLETASTAAAVDAAITTAAVEAPVAVTSAVNGAKSSAVAFGACGSTDAGGSQAKCTQSVAKLMYGVLGFPVILHMTSGAFGTLASCTAATAVGSDTLDSLFPNANFTAGTGTATPSENGIPSGYCQIAPKLGVPDRNRGFEAGKDHGGGPSFAETGILKNGGSSTKGVLTTMGQALFGNYAYKITAADKLVFDYDSTTGAGFNGRLVNERFALSATGGTGSRSYYYYNGTSWVNTLWPTCFSQACSPWELQFNFTGPTWDTAQNNATLAAAIGAGSNVSLGIFMLKFGGAVPTQTALTESIDNGKIHLHHNPTGQAEFQVATTLPPGFSGGTNPCWDRNAATPCLASDGNAIVPVRMNMTLATADASGYKRVATLTQNQTSGKYYMRPMFGPTGFSGVMGFVDIATGRITTDEFLRERAIKVVLTSSECGTNGLPSSGCAAGKVYNVELDWSQCQGPGSACPGYNEIGGDNEVSGYAFTVQQNFKQRWEQYCTPTGGCMGFGLLGYGNWDNLSLLKVTATAGAGNDSFAIASSGQATSAGQYNIATKMTCIGQGTCSIDGFFFVDSSGNPYVDADATTPQNMFGVANVGVYTEAYLNSQIADFDSTTAGNQNLSAAAANYYIFEGPVPNPNFLCDKEPFFVDGNANGTLDCQVVSGVSQAANGDVTFSWSGEYQWYVSDMSVDQATRTARAANPLRENQNGYAFGDPVGTKKLLTTAFNGWFDGKHTISATTDFSALQIFALIYLYYTEGEGNRYINGVTGIPAGEGRFNEVSAELESLEAMNKSISEAFVLWKN